MSFVHDTFTDTAGVNLSAHAGETGASWTKHGSFTGDILITDVNRARSNTVASSVYYASGAPAAADYSVAADIFVKSVINSGMGVVGRVATGADTLYWARYAKSATVAQWQLQKDVAGLNTTLGTFDQTLSAGVTYALKLVMTGTTIELYVDGVQRISVTDSAVAAAGRAGARASAAALNTTGFHLDNIFATEPPTSLSYATNPLALTTNVDRKSVV